MGKHVWVGLKGEGLKVVRRALFHSSSIGSFSPEQRKIGPWIPIQPKIKPRHGNKKWFLYLYFVLFLLKRLPRSSRLYLRCFIFFSFSFAAFIPVTQHIGGPLLMNQKIRKEKEIKAAFCQERKWINRLSPDLRFTILYHMSFCQIPSRGKEVSLGSVTKGPNCN